MGEIIVRDMQLELRHALEPWHVLGEEQDFRRHGALCRQLGGTFAGEGDGWVDERYTLACNGAALPMQRTEVPGEYVAGVRFKAWQPYSALHPTIGAQVPLIFDVYDKWSGRSSGGMTHHVAHPGGRAYEISP